MQPRPVIGLAMQTREPTPCPAPPAWVVGQKYVRVLAASGALPWLVPLLPQDEATLHAVYDRLDGVFLTGGADVEPCHYGEERQPCCGETDPARDQTELLLIRWAVAEGKPLFGVCRGSQLINVALGGSLYQDLREQLPGSLRHDCFAPSAEFTRDHLAHRVRVAPDSRLARLLGSEEVAVNSMHHQGVRRLAPGLRPTAFAPDGLIEAFEGIDRRFLLGVQWHPEELAERDDNMRRLFTAFVEAAGSRQP